MIDKKVLVVEDNALNRKVFENIIGQRYHVDSAENGLIAIEKVKAQSIDLILMDIQMPVLDGISACRILKSENLTKAPIIALSAYANDSDKELFISAGFDDFISKPIKPQFLLKVLNSFLETQEYYQPVLNSEILSEITVQKLLKYNTSQNIKIVYQDFLEECHMLLHEIENHLQNKNYAEIGEKLHIIKGNSGTLGAQAIHEYSKIIEYNIKSQNFENIEKEYLNLNELVKTFENHINVTQILNS
jgi:two-component system, OmpR family, alkaline phosphatase synthesis response regulator PhoP